MSLFRAPEVATTRVMGQTLATLFAFGGAAGVFLTAGSAPGSHRWVLLSLALAALLTAAVAARWAAGWLRAAFHVPVAAGTVLITIAIWSSPEPVTGLTAATLVSFVVIDAYVFFAPALAIAHLVFAVLSTNVALLAATGMPLPTVLALDLVLIGLGTVTRRLVLRASSACRDPLTGLGNRRSFDEALRELVTEAERTGEPLSAVLVDLDHFKAINDTAGHEAGDRMLCRVADAWRRDVPAGAVLARHGGDEFALLLPRTDGEAALTLVHRVLTRNPDISLSCGVAAFATRETASQLMRRADRALYEAKALGRGRAELDGVPFPPAADEVAGGTTAPTA